MILSEVNNFYKENNETINMSGYKAPTLPGEETVNVYTQDSVYTGELDRVYTQLPPYMELVTTKPPQPRNNFKIQI